MSVHRHLVTCRIMRGMPKRRRIVEGAWLLSPTALSLGMLIFSVCMTLVPPKLYQFFIGEKDQMYLNWPMYGYMALMTAFFLAGVALHSKYFSRIRVLKPRPIRASSFNLIVATSLIVWPLILLNLLNLSVLVSALGVSGFINSIAHPSNAGRELVSQLLAGNGLSWLSGASAGMLSFLVWLVMGRMVVDQQAATRRVYGWVLLLAFFAVCLISAATTQARGPVLVIALQVIFGIAAAYITKYRLSLRRIVVSIASVALLGAVFFTAVQQSRLNNAVGPSVSAGDAAIGAFIGYFPASYNRLASVMDGKLTLPGAGSGYLSLLGVYTFPGLSNMVGVGEIGRSMGLPVPSDEYTAWRQAFQSVRSSGLNDSFIWPTVWGAVLLDLKGFAFLWWIAYGMICAWGFQAFRQSAVVGLIMYPWMAVSILQWYGDAVIGNRTLPVLLAVALALAAALKLVSEMPQRPARKARAIH